MAIKLILCHTMVPAHSNLINRDAEADIAVKVEAVAEAEAVPW